MASTNDHTQPVADKTINSMHQSKQDEHQPDKSAAGRQDPAPSGHQQQGVGSRRGFRSAGSLLGTPHVGRRVLNDVDLMRYRRVNFNNVIRKQMELICEEKISKNKLEEVHSSIPSSIKSTFIMSFSPDGQRVASTHGDHRIYICDLNTGKFLDTLEGHPKTPWCLAWHPTNREILASGCLAGEVRVWDLKSKACETWIGGRNTIITSLDFHPKERVLVVATANDIHFWDWSESEPFAKTTTMHDREKVKYVLFDSTGTKLITGISNSPRYGGFGMDSLQNRTIDSYMLPGGNLQAENMTQTSENTASPANNHRAGHFNLGGQESSSSSLSTASASASSLSPHDRPTNFSTIIHNLRDNNISTNTNDIINNNNNNRNNNSTNTSTNEQAVHCRNTMTLSRVAFLYRELEALEDSMRNTSFAPYVGPRVIDSTDSDSNETNNNDASQRRPSSQRESEQSSGQSSGTPAVNNDSKSNDNNDDHDDDDTNIHNQSNHNQPPRNNLDKDETGPATMSTSTASNMARTSNTFEPHLVAFDESLEQLQLPPLVVDGQAVNLATIIERYPLDMSHQLHYDMQSESINQVNQNFIRISKLMSSARLYRQVVQQIQSNMTNSSNNQHDHHHHQANVILVARSVSPRSVRLSSNYGVLYREMCINDFRDPNGALRINRTSDPVMALQFRNSARNVPLVTICKIDLIAARTLCIIRSQELVDQALASAALSSSSAAASTRNLADQFNHQLGSSSDGTEPAATRDNREEEPRSFNTNTYCSLLTQLHSSLTTINHAPLTTSNVYSHITSLRVLVDKLFKIMCGLVGSSADGRRLTDLIHKTAFSLTGRKWSVPLGPSYDQLRLDVIHTLCIVDLTLHFVRQIQLLQMQRISIMARIEEFRRSSSPSQASLSTSGDAHSAHNNVEPRTPTEIIERGLNCGMGTNLASSSRMAASTSKRKDPNDPNDDKDKQSKRRKVDEDAEMVTKPASSHQPRHEANLHGLRHSGNAASSTLTDAQQPPLFEGQPVPVMEPMAPADRLFIWRDPQPSSIEQSLQRILMATASSMTNQHILVRIYHRLHGASSLPPLQAAASIIDNSIEQQLPPLSHLAPFESRRRALSQDNNNHHHHHQHQTRNSPTTESPPQQEQESSIPYLLQSSLSAERNAASSSWLPPQHQSSSSSRGAGHHRTRPPTAFQVNFVPSSSSGLGAPGSGYASRPVHEPTVTVGQALPYDHLPRQPHLHLYQTRGFGQHLWYNQWTIPLPVNNSNFRLQCWNFSLNAIPNIKDSRSNVITNRCRIQNDASVDVSSTGTVVACLVPRDDVLTCMPSFDLKIFSLRTADFGACYYKLPQGPNAVSVSLSPSGNYAVVGLASHKSIGNDTSDEDLTIAKVFRLDSRETYGFVRDIKIKRGDSSLSLNAIKWMPRGIIYNVGPQHHQRYQAARMRNVLAS